MGEKIHVLLVDDYPFTIEGYTNYLKIYQNINSHLDFKIQSAVCCQSAINKLEKHKFDLVLLDIRIPPTTDNKFNSGEDIGRFVKTRYPKTKLVIITGHYEPLILGSIIHNINPIGLVYKSDFDQMVLDDLLKSILNEVPYYSAKILKLLRKNIGSKIILDKTDKLIILEISKGKKTKDLVDVIPLSIGGIEKRKRALKELFGIPKADDKTFIKSIIKKGFL